MAEVNAVNVNQQVNALGSSAETANQKTYSEEDIKLFDIDKDGKLNVAERAAVEAYHNNEDKIKFDFDGNGELDRAEIAAYDAYQHEKLEEVSEELVKALIADSINNPAFRPKSLCGSIYESFKPHKAHKAPPQPTYGDRFINDPQYFTRVEPKKED